MKSNKGFALILILLGLLIVGFLAMQMLGGGGAQEPGTREPRKESMPKHLINQANSAVEKHKQVQASSDDTYKDLGLE